jgi:hypothetical protein
VERVQKKGLVTLRQEVEWWTIKVLNDLGIMKMDLNDRLISKNELNERNPEVY